MSTGVSVLFDPDRRHLLVDALRPPPGTRLDAAVGTTFSLDLQALLIAPLSFALFDARIGETGQTTDPLALMESVRRHAGHIDVFYQAGQVAIPPRDLSILALLEDSVHPTVAPRPGFIFHPKIWVLKYVGDGDASYRLLVLTRNLTFDRSWDLVVGLDGSLADATPERRAQNRPLADFLISLPAQTSRPMDAERHERVRRLAAEILDVEWALPDGFSRVQFLPSGIAGYEHSWPERSDRALVISPFLTPERLQWMAERTNPVFLVSRAESLDRLEMSLLERFEKVFILADVVEHLGLAEEEANADASVEEEGEVPPPDPSVPVREELAERPGHAGAGLHAKALAVDQGWYAELRIGSTNATTAGWEGNVEFDVALVGAKKRTGVDALLGWDRPGDSLMSLLTEYRRASHEPLKETSEEAELRRLEALSRKIAAIPLKVAVRAEDAYYRLTISSKPPLPLADGVEVRCWPASRTRDDGRLQTPGVPVDYTTGGLSLQGITSFVIFELSAVASGQTVVIVSNAQMEGAPDDRAERLLAEQLQSKRDVLRYLLLLLADLGDGAALQQLQAMFASPDSQPAGDWQPSVPLLETMVRALARRPEALDPINRLITDLERSEAGRRLIPDGLREIWPAIWEARNQST